MDFDFFKTMIVPLFAGCATLLFSLMTRNSNLSDRLRTVAKGIIDGCDANRKKNLGDQMSMFWLRYHINQVAITLVITSVFLFTLMFSLAALEFNHQQHDFVWSTILFRCGSGLLFLAFFMTLVDIWTSGLTLGKEKRYAEDTPALLIHEPSLR
jgi:hypothetical protein